MSDSTMNDLVVSLQRSNRRWKALALGLLAVLGIVIVVGTWMTVRATTLARREADLARQGEMEARQAAQRTMYESQIRLAERSWSMALQENRQ
jgi:hypothetical protein